MEGIHLLFLALLLGFLLVYSVHLTLGIDIFIICLSRFFLAKGIDGGIAVASQEVVLHLCELTMQSVTSRFWHHGINTVSDHSLLNCWSLEHLTGEIGDGHQGDKENQREPVLSLAQIDFLEIYLHSSFLFCYYVIVSFSVIMSFLVTLSFQ